MNIPETPAAQLPQEADCRLCHDDPAVVLTPPNVDRHLLHGRPIQDGSVIPYSDSNNDGIPDVADNCPNICNSDRWDADNDGIGDVCDPVPGCGGCVGPPCEQECIIK